MKFKKYSTASDTYTTLPAVYQTSGADVENYQIFGASSGVGEETENVYKFYGNGYYDDYMTFQPNAVDQCSYVIPVTNGDVYTISYNVPSVQSGMSERMYFLSSPTSMIAEDTGIITTTGHKSHSITMDDESYTVNYFCIVVPATATEVMLVKGSTAPTTYIPFGYKIPLSISDGTNTSNYDLMLGDSKLYEDEYVDFETQKVYRTIALITHDNKEFITSDNKRFCVRRTNNG